VYPNSQEIDNSVDMVCFHQHVHRRVAIGTAAIRVCLQFQQEPYEGLVQFLNCVEQRAVILAVQDIHVVGGEVVVETQQLIKFTSLNVFEQLLVL